MKFNRAWKNRLNQPANRRARRNVEVILLLIVYCTHAQDPEFAVKVGA